MRKATYVSFPIVIRLPTRLIFPWYKISWAYSLSFFWASSVLDWCRKGWTGSKPKSIQCKRGRSIIVEVQLEVSCTRATVYVWGRQRETGISLLSSFQNYRYQTVRTDGILSLVFHLFSLMQRYSNTEAMYVSLVTRVVAMYNACV